MLQLVFAEVQGKKRDLDFCFFFFFFFKKEVKRLLGRFYVKQAVH